MKSVVCIFLTFFGMMAIAKQNYSYRENCFMKPCQLLGDFDGDGKPDNAILVANKTGKKGIQIKFANGKDVVIGAGKTIGNGGNDFSWMNHWELHKGKIEEAEGKPPKVKGDSLLVEKAESASAIIYWDGNSFKWYQQGD